MKLNIATPHKSLPPLDVEEVTVPTVAGETMILPGHARLVSQIGEGTFRYRSASESKSFPVKNGVVSVHHDQIIVLCDEAELP